VIAIAEASRAGLFKKNNWLNNLVSGVIVGVVALPLAMAFAIASGVKPEQGIYTSIFAGLMVSLFGGSRLQIAGPTGAFIVVLSDITAKYGVTGLQIATLMAGVILVGLGLAKMGAVIKYIPTPVIIGFTSGIGVTIWFGQWRNFFGLPVINGEHFHEKIIQLFQVLPQLNLTTTLLALLSLALVIFSSRMPGIRKIPGPLVALVAGTLIQYFCSFEEVRTIGTAFGGIPRGLPEFSVPTFKNVNIIVLIGPAFTIAMLGAIESLLSAVVADGMAGTRHNSNQELVGQGLANMITPFFGGFAATGAIARTATNIRNGGNSPLSGVIHSVTLILILLFLAPLATHIPLATLAAILFVVAWNMSEAKHFIRIMHQAPIADVSILLITFFLTVFADLVIAVNIGVILAMMHFLKRMANSVEIKNSKDKNIVRELVYHGVDNLSDDLIIFAIDGPFFFAAVEKFEHALQTTHTEPKIVVIDMERVPFIDITGIQSLERVIMDLKNKKIIVRLSGCNARVSKKLYKAGVITLVGMENRFTELRSAVNR